MDVKALEALQAKVTELEAKVVALETEKTNLTQSVEEEKAKVAKLTLDNSTDADVIRTRSREYTKLAQENESLKAELTAQNDRQSARDILDIVENALEMGKVTPAEVAGYAENPTKWLTANYGEAFTATQLEGLFNKRSAVVNTRDRKSSGSFSQNLASTLSREVQDGLRKLGLDPALATVTNADDAKRITDSKKGK